ncbi:MAG: low molecular weight protein-tyrosine-phosphatase [Deltaproteobacteria bacterium]|nr:low molecular weight protein-tyrosine-phosphatase [Deltaproteobacteria bacterium]
MKTTRILFVCLGNICRSPTALAVMRHLVKERGLEAVVHTDSAGTGGWHAGNPPDARSAAVGAKRGIPLTGVARQVTVRDFESFDYLIAMDRSNREDLWALAPTPAARAKVHLLRDFAPAGPKHADVPDPYYGGPAGFDQVFDICLQACDGLLTSVIQSLPQAPSQTP